jgi:extracellular elastinolytic metalloproteinase
MMHDLTYQYGFTESAGNFQDNNFEKGGAGADAIHGFVQVPSGMNNAFFISPPDGTRGVIGMFIFNLTTPSRDGALDNEIVVFSCFI